jgi:predicted nucleic acid-binding protein
VNLFIDANVALAACGRPVGASRAIFDLASQNGWTLMTSAYVIAEISTNLPRLGATAVQVWRHLQGQLLAVRDVWTLDRPAVFSPAKDRPVLFTAAAWAQVLLTLDRCDFGAVMGGRFYGLDILPPGVFLERERSAGRLSS